MYLLTNERYITYQKGFLFGHLGHAQGLDLGVPWGVGGSKIFFSEIQPDMVCELLTCIGTCTGIVFWVPTPWGLGEGSKIYISEHGHVAYQIKGDEQ